MSSWDLGITGLRSLLYLIISVLGLPQSASYFLVMTKSAKFICLASIPFLRLGVSRVSKELVPFIWE